MTSKMIIGTWNAAATKAGGIDGLSARMIAVVCDVVCVVCRSIA